MVRTYLCHCNRILHGGKSYSTNNYIRVSCSRYNNCYNILNCLVGGPKERNKTTLENCIILFALDLVLDQIANKFSLCCLTVKKFKGENEYE